MIKPDFKSSRCNPRRRRIGPEYYIVLARLISLAESDPTILSYLNTGRKGKAWARLSTKFVNSKSQNIFDIFVPDNANNVVNHAINTVAKQLRESSTVARRTTTGPVRPN